MGVFGLFGSVSLPYVPLPEFDRELFTGLRPQQISKKCHCWILVPSAILLLLLGGAFLLGSRSCDRELERLRKQNASFRSRLVQASSTLPPPPSTTCPTPPTTPPTPAPRTLCEIIKDHAWAGPLPVPAVRRADSPYDLTYLSSENGTESGVKKGLHVPRVMWQDDLYMRNQTYAHELYVAVASVACKWHGLPGKEGAAGE